MQKEISSFAIACFDRELTAAAKVITLEDQAVAVGFVNGFVASFCLRTFSEIEKEVFFSLCERGFRNLGII